MDVLWRMRWVWAGIFLLPWPSSRCWRPSAEVKARDRAYDSAPVLVGQYLTAIERTIIRLFLRMSIAIEKRAGLTLDEPVDPRAPAQRPS